MMHTDDSDGTFTFVNGAMLPQYVGKKIIIAGNLTDLALRNCKMATTDGVNINVKVESSEHLKRGFYEFRAKALSATTVQSIDCAFYEDGENEENKNTFNLLCKVAQMIPQKC